jgi:preprotein translocase subunit SecE
MAKDQAPSAPKAQRWGQSKGKGPKGGQPPATTIAAAEKPAPKRRTSPLQFFREVRAEARKITWTSRKETWITSVMVFIMVVLATVFFAVVDIGISKAVTMIIKIGQ